MEYSLEFEEYMYCEIILQLTSFVWLQYHLAVINNFHDYYTAFNKNTNIFVIICTDLLIKIFLWLITSR